MENVISVNTTNNSGSISTINRYYWGGGNGFKLLGVKKYHPERVINKLLYGLIGCDLLQTPFSTLKMFFYIIAKTPDRLILNNLHGYYLNVPLFLFLLRFYKGSLAFYMHDLWLVTGGCVHYDKIRCNRLSQGCIACPQLNRYPSSLIDFRRINLVLKRKLLATLEFDVYASSEYIKSEFIKSKITAKTLKVLLPKPNTELTNKYKQSIKQNKGEIKHICFVATKWNIQKGLSELKEVVEYFEKVDKIHLHIVGGLDKLNKKEFKSREGVSIYGYLIQDELFQLLSKMDCMVQLSREESYGLIVVESQLLGVPCIGFNKTGIGETILKPFSSLLNYNGNIQSMIEEILNFPVLNVDDKKQLQLRSAYEFLS